MSLCVITLRFNEELLPSLLRSLEKSPNLSPERFLEEAKDRLLWIATPEGVLKKGTLRSEDELANHRATYFTKQERTPTLSPYYPPISYPYPFK